MNCAEFEHVVFEWLDESLPTGIRHEAERHLDECQECRETLAAHRRLGEQLSDRLDVVSKGLVLQDLTRKRILRSCEGESSAEHFWAWWARLPWKWSSAFILIAVASVLASRSLMPIEPPNGSLQEASVLVSVNAPFVITSYTFRKEGKVVVDTLLPQRNAVRQTFLGPRPKTRSEPLPTEQTL